MKISDVYKFKDDWMVAGDLDGEVVVTIDGVSVAEMPDGSKKLAIVFKELKKVFICNITNAKRIAKICGSDNTDNWNGNKVRLVRQLVEFRGEEVEAIRAKNP